MLLRTIPKERKSHKTLWPLDGNNHWKSRHGFDRNT